MRVALMYEHPAWSLSLVERIRDRGHDVTAVDVGTFDTDTADAAALVSGDHDVWVNRVNAMPSAGRHDSVVAATRHLLLSLEMAGRRVINGERAHSVGVSKTAQSALLHHLGLHSPRSVAISTPVDAERAAETIGYPVLTKPNVGGSGSDIVRHDSRHDLSRAVAMGAVGLGLDGTGLVQEVVPSADGLVHRIEMLFGELFYASDQPIRDGVYNYCAADGCAIVDDGEMSLVTPDVELVDAVGHILSSASIDVGSVEYLIDARTGDPCFYDINPYSNFVTGHDDELGFDPLDRYIDAVIAHA